MEHPPPPPIPLGPGHYDPERHDLTAPGAPYVHLTQREHQLMVRLLDARGHVLGIRSIDDATKSLTWRLRGKLAAWSPEVTLRTIRGVGLELVDAAH